MPETPPPQLAWSGSATDGRVVLRSPAGEALSFATLEPLAEHLRQRQDPWGGFVTCAAALGAALHCTRHPEDGMLAALDEAAVILHGLPVAGTVGQFRRTAERHADILTHRENAARLVLEARRMQREQIEAVGRAIELVRAMVHSPRSLLLAWPGGSACDLGAGILTGAVIAADRDARRPEDILVSGPPRLAASAVADLAGQGIPALAVDDATARAKAATVGAVLARCSGSSGTAEAWTAELAAEAIRRRTPVFAIGVQRVPVVVEGSLSALPPGCQSHVISIPVPE